MNELWKPIAAAISLWLVAFMYAPAYDYPTETQVAPTAIKSVFGEAQNEVVLLDGSRADGITDGYAIEVDWSSKWAEGVGQALLYGKLTNKQPALLLLVKDARAEKHHLLRAAVACSAANIELYTYTVQEK